MEIGGEISTIETIQTKKKKKGKKRPKTIRRGEGEKETHERIKEGRGVVGVGIEWQRRVVVEDELWAVVSFAQMELGKVKKLMENRIKWIAARVKKEISEGDKKNGLGLFILRERGFRANYFFSLKGGPSLIYNLYIELRSFPLSL